MVAHCDVVVEFPPLPRSAPPPLPPTRPPVPPRGSSQLVHHHHHVQQQQQIHHQQQQQQQYSSSFSSIQHAQQFQQIQNRQQQIMSSMHIVTEDWREASSFYSGSSVAYGSLSAQLFSAFLYQFDCGFCFFTFFYYERF